MSGAPARRLLRATRRSLQQLRRRASRHGIAMVEGGGLTCAIGANVTPRSGLSGGNAWPPFLPYCRAPVRSPRWAWTPTHGNCTASG